MPIPSLLSSRRRECQSGIGEPVGHIAFGVLQEMRVHEERDRGVRVAEPTLHLGNRAAARGHIGGRKFNNGVPAAI